MKTIITLILTIVLSTTTAFAQSIEGIATYKTDRQVDLKMDTGKEGMDEETQNSIQAQLRKQFQKEFTLKFNNVASLYEEVASLDKPQAPQAGGIQIRISGVSDILYKNTKSKTFTRASEIMDKPFLIEDALEKPEWKLEKETKNIGEYLCFKATLTEEVEEQSFSSETMETETIKKERITTAWYTLNIPVQHGPSDFWGLPGLILEINDGKQTILCSKIILNPKDELDIYPPTKGEKVNQVEFDEIQKKKNDEMMERFKDSNNKKGDEKTFSIKIGG
ncbi:GLPGLI family protein [Patiriisocius marinistellae]|uniref:GLPGLI family protein n=1 Tax=Patiriisocius marinistellae TaxID=2494560 RepID=A0A5J4FZ87_9FLAO|nr:GLPGLI family protein [Patiriisocius marinistellae]GEQ85489.1 GLPGLI family protein [Patiriisocius marinistellae]